MYSDGEMNEIVKAEEAKKNMARGAVAALQALLALCDIENLWSDARNAVVDAIRFHKDELKKVERYKK